MYKTFKTQNTSNDTKTQQKIDIKMANSSLNISLVRIHRMLPNKAKGNEQSRNWFVPNSSNVSEINDFCWEKQF